MTDLPLTANQNPAPLNAGQRILRVVRPHRAEDEGAAISIFNNTDENQIATRITNGDGTVVPAARRAFDIALTDVEKDFLGRAYRNGMAAENAAQLELERQKKAKEWAANTNNFFLEQALSLNDPTVSAELSRVATNIQIGTEIFASELENMQSETGTMGYVGNFIDRYLLRSLPIGGFEQLTNRNERKGQELQTAALTMTPDQYTAFVQDYIKELKSEGIFTGDNIFAILDGFAELKNTGEDPHELLNRSFGLLDVATVALPAAKAAISGAKIAELGRIGSILKADTPARRVAAISNPEAASEAAAKLAKNPVPSIDTIRDARLVAEDPAMHPAVEVPVTKLVEDATENSILRTIKHTNEVGGLGIDLKSPEVVRAAEAAVKTLKDHANNPVVNITATVTPDVSGNMVLSATIGTVRDGKPFTSVKAANRVRRKLAEDFPTAVVKRGDGNDGRKGFYIHVDKQLDIAKYADPIDASPTYGFVKSIYARIFGSKFTTEDKLTNQLALMGEGLSSVLGGGSAVKKIIKNLNRVSNKSQKVISDILSDLRDGKDAFKRGYYSDAEFSDLFRTFHPEKRDPTDIELQAYHDILELGDATYIMRAHLRMQEYIRRGYHTLFGGNGERVVARRVGNVPAKTDVLNLKTGILGIAEDSRYIWRVDKELDGGVIYVANPTETKVLSHSDILGYNAGGARLNPRANHFIVSGDENPRAFLTAFTEDEANTALKELKTIQEAIVASGGKDINAIDKVILANNTWNPSIQSAVDLIDWLEIKKLDFSKSLFKKARNEAVETDKVTDEVSRTFGEYVSHSMSRSDDLLTEFGGAEAYQVDPVRAIFMDFQSIGHQYSYNRYTQIAMQAWLKAARREGSGWKVPDTLNDAAALNEAQRIGTGTKRSAELDHQRAIIRHRTMMKGEFGRKMEHMGQQFQEFVHGKTGLKVAKNPVDRAANQLLSFAYHTAFGFWNIGQAFVQGFHAPVVLAMAPTHGLKGLAMSAPIMAILSTTTREAEKLGIKRLAKWARLPEERVTELVDYYRVSGRDIVDGSTMEAGTGSSWMVSQWRGESFLPSALVDIQAKASRLGRGAMQNSLLFFRTGERFGRATAINTAVLEYMEKFPNLSLRTAHASKWITRREQTLSFNMTNTNRAAFQEGLGKLPAQWYGYTFRAMESVFLGRDLTKGERLRAGLILGPMFGLTGMGAESGADWIAEKLDVEAAGTIHTLLKRGLIDAGLSSVGVDINFADRIAPITQITDTYSNITGGQTGVETALGPSATIAAGFISSLVEVAGEIYHGNSVSITEDTVRVARQFAGIDNVFKAYGILKNGMYRSRSGRTYPFELDTTDAIAQIMGFSPREITEWYTLNRAQRNHRDKVVKIARELRIDFIRAVEMMDNGEHDRGLALMRELQQKIVLTGFSLHDQALLRRALRVQTSAELNTFINKEVMRDNMFTAKAAKNIFTPIEGKF